MLHSVGGLPSPLMAIFFHLFSQALKILLSPSKSYFISDRIKLLVQSYCPKSVVLLQLIVGCQLFFKELSENNSVTLGELYTIRISLNVTSISQ